MGKQVESWPNGNRIAVLVSVLFETWAENKSPAYFPRTTPLKPGTVDYGAIQWGQFGGNEGVWRLIRILDQYSIRGTMFCSGRSAELYPEAVRQMTRSGHDIAGHGYTQDIVLSYLTPEEQRESIRQVLDILERTSGRRPEGWATAVYGWNHHTFDLLVQEGVKWYADALDISLPRQQKTETGSIYAIPWSDFVDNRVLRGNPRHYFDVYRDTFDYLYEHEPMGLLHVAIHSHFGGRPLMAAMFLKVLEYIKGFPDVWFPRHRELIHWMAEQEIDELPYAGRFFG
ncbi:MAG: polysaccharide deacetylase family protein [Candidatus Binatia bacterium]|jgi:peptidoglycan/xylan/chitin deacetylase (PgdA/CDA1 family)|nr:polysaccharide deacetylase family protein [Candidatus Binatia bacterium]